MMYQLLIEESNGAVIMGYEGDLLSCCNQAKEYAVNMDSYHKVRRELIRARGAYSSFFPWTNDEATRPVQVLIMEIPRYSERQDHNQARFISRMGYYNTRERNS